MISNQRDMDVAPSSATNYVSRSGSIQRTGPELGLRWHLPGLLARLGLLERIQLAPEGATFAELKRLTDTMIAAGRTLFVLSYHSPSVVAGNTPYVHNASELQELLRVIEQYCEYFRGTCGGEGSTPDEVRILYDADRSRSSNPSDGLHNVTRAAQIGASNA
jgi:hypothetical protein